MEVFEREETYIHERKFREDSSATDVASAVMTITYPCESGSTDIDMDRMELGLYQGNWEIPSTATFGEYTVEVTATSDDGAISKFVSSFIILPFNLVPEVRAITGIYQNKTIETQDLASITWNAFLEASEEIFSPIIEEKVGCLNSSSRYYTKKRNLVDGALSCEDNIITGLYKDSCGDIHEAQVTIIDATTGEVEILDEDGDSLTNCICSILINYKIHSHSWTEYLHRRAVCYLAAHKVLLRLGELRRATSADLNPSQNIDYANPERMYKEYKRIVKKIRYPIIGGV